MKFLEYTPLARLNTFLSHVNLGEHLIQGVLEAYSCKLAGFDKKLSRSLEQEVIDSLATSPQDLATSPLGPLTSSGSRRTLIYLILTLNHMYPDYDFSMLRAHHFTKECAVILVKQQIEQSLVEVSKLWELQVGDDTPLLEGLWSAIDEVIGLADCDVYQYKSELDGDPFAEKGSMWAFNYFFYNKKLRRILYFSCKCMSKLALSESSSDETASEDVFFVDDMNAEV
eukprot:SM000095S25023  [mRNA]  locus=s95:485055:487878:- [translate_table: standard]